ncbi:MAG: hypothetical protein ACMZ67_19860 [Nioella sp.]
MTISKAILDELLQGVEGPEDLLGDTGLMKELKIKLMERMLGAELTEPPRVYRRACGSIVRLLFLWRSSLRRMPPLSLVA